jgi:WD40 repeat protein
MTVKVFYSYAPADEALRQELEKHLSTLRRDGAIAEWHKGLIGAGREVSVEIEQHLGTAQIVLLLISADFLCSDDHWDVEMKTALDRHDRREALVVPILLRPCAFRTARLAGLRALPDEPVTSWDDPDEAWAYVAEELRVAVKALETGDRSLWARPLDDRASPRLDRDLGRGDTFLHRIERVALLRDPGVRITRHRAPEPFAGVLEVLVGRGALVEAHVIGALEQPVTEALVAEYQAGPERTFRDQDPLLRSTLIHAGPQAAPDLLRSAFRRGVKLVTFAEYQGLLDFSRYLEGQTRTLEADPIYPPWLYVEQPARWSVAGGREEKATESALRTLWELLDAPHPRFALVLGDFGAGKTFLLHELARRMATEGHPLVPVLVEMSKLEKQRSLKALLAQHFAMADMGRFDPDAFMYMLAEGRIALLFDGFDELALRLTYDRAVEHFETVMAAAEGQAKVVVTSRTQHFLTDQQVRLEMARRAEQVKGYRLVQLDRFGEPQIRRFLGNLIEDQAEAEERYQLLDEVKDLLGLSHNPRMLGFIARIEPEKLREARAQGREITAAKLYEILIGQWLDFEFARANPPGAPKGISRVLLRSLVSRLARLFWARNAEKLVIRELGEALMAEGIEHAVVEHMIGSGSLLVRDAEGQFSFVHRSVMEWLVADAAAREVVEAGDAAALGQDEMSELMADFFISLATPRRAEAWAWETAGRPGEGNAKKNAEKVRKRIEARQALGEDETEVAGTVDLEGQDLRGQDWSGVDWQGANLARADLRGSMLREANLRGASLVGARLERADLEGSKLAGADLTGAELGFARLMDADLRDSRGLTVAQLRGAKLLGAKGMEIEGLAAAGAAPPTPGGAEPTWAAASACKAVAWSPSGDFVVSGYYDGAVQLWDAVSGQAIWTSCDHSGPVRSVAVSPDGRTLASASDDRTVRLWNVAAGRSIRVFEGHVSGVSSVAFGPDGETLASGSLDKTVRLWDIATGSSMRAFEGHMLGVLSVAFSPDGETLASASDDNTMLLWDIASGRSIRAFEGHMDSVWSVAFSPNGLTLASGSNDKTVRLWNVATGHSIRAFEGHAKAVLSIAFSSDGLTLASGSRDNTVRLWDVATGLWLGFSGHTNWVSGVAFSPDGLTLASGSSDNTVRLWDVATGRALRVLVGRSNELRNAAFSSDGQTLASGSDDSTVRLWSVPTGRALGAFEGHTHGVWSVAFGPDGQTLASGSLDHTARLWDVAAGSALGALEGHKSAVMSVAFSPDGKTLASGSLDHTARLWDVAAGSTVCTLEGHKNWVWSVAFSPDGKTLASGSSDKTVRLWEVAAGRCLHTFEGHEHGVRSVAFGVDGLTLASGSDDGTVRLWGVLSRRCFRTFEGHESGVRSVTFDQDGLTLASGSTDKTVRLWDIATGRCFHTFEGHKDGVLSVVFSPDGKTLASASADGTIRLWDVATARCLAILLATPEGWAAFTPDGRYKLGGDIAGAFWHVIGLCRFEPGELDPYLPNLRLPDDASFLTLPPAEPLPADR